MAGNRRWEPSELSRVAEWTGQGLSAKQIAQRLTAEGSERSPDSVKRIRARYGWHPPRANVTPTPTRPDLDLERLQLAIRNTPTALWDLSRQFDRSEATIREALETLRGAQHLNIVERAGKVLLDTKAPPRFQQQLQALYQQRTMEITIAVASDIHAGSGAQQLTALGTFLRTAYDRGVRDVFVPGDITAGHNVYRGQVYDQFATGGSPQIRIADFALPAMPGLTYHVIGGNHDYSFIKASGFDVVRELCDRRDDMCYYGYDIGDVPLLENFVVRMWHPSGGVPYAASYRLQKGMEQFAYSELVQAVEERADPRLRLVLSGHLHIMLGPLKLGTIYGLQSGCFEGQTNYLKRKGLFPAVGGWIIHLSIAENGMIRRLQPEWLDYRAIEGDWRNYPGIGEAQEETRERLYEWVT